MTDVSDLGIGATVYQNYKDEIKKPIYFHSKKQQTNKLKLSQ